MSAFSEQLSVRTEKIEAELLRFLPKEEGMQKRILEACNYSVRNGGKRIRPLLMESAFFLCKLRKEAEEGKKALQDGASKENADFPESFAEHAPEALYQRYAAEYKALLAPFLAAIEMIHSSSLVHDDLPCMDNDRLRRGKPSTWAKYGEAMGTLAGDGLMIYAFETGAGAAVRTKEDAARVLRAVSVLAKKTGIFGMIGGQTVDVELTGKRPDAAALDFIYRLKTGALLEASVMIGAILAGADGETEEKLERAARALGLAFQIQDDILDETASQEELGKPVGSDERNQKTTYVTHFGMERAKQDARAYTEEAMRLLEEIADYPFLTALCGYLLERRK